MDAVVTKKLFWCFEPLTTKFFNQFLYILHRTPVNDFSAARNHSQAFFYFPHILKITEEILLIYKQKANRTKAVGFFNSERREPMFFINNPNLRKFETFMQEVPHFPPKGTKVDLDKLEDEILLFEVEKIIVSLKQHKGKDNYYLDLLNICYPTKRFLHISIGTHINNGIVNNKILIIFVAIVVACNSYYIVECGWKRY